MKATTTKSTEVQRAEWTAFALGFTSVPVSAPKPDKVTRREMELAKMWGWTK